MSSTVPTTLGITHVLEAPTFSIPPVAHRPPQSPGCPPLPPAPSLSSLASPFSCPLAPPCTISTPPSTPPCLPTPALPLSTWTPSSQSPLIQTPTWSAHNHHLLPSPLRKHFAPLPSLTLNSLEKKPPPILSASPKLSLTPSFPHSPKTVGCTSNLPVTSLTTSPLKTSLSRIFPCPSLKHPLPLSLPLPRHHPLLSLSQYFILPSMSAHLSTSSPPCLASLPTIILISTWSTMNRAATSGSHLRNLSTASSSTTFPRSKTSTPPHPHSSSPPSTPMSTTPSTSIQMACFPQSISVPK